jgi:hypothetical protein
MGNDRKGKGAGELFDEIDLGFVGERIDPTHGFTDDGTIDISCDAAREEGSGDEASIDAMLFAFHALHVPTHARFRALSVEGLRREMLLVGESLSELVVPGDQIGEFSMKLDGDDGALRSRLVEQLLKVGCGGVGKIDFGEERRDWHGRPRWVER